MLTSRVRILLNPLFVISLFLLLVNDHYLKQASPSELTGKLSDFSGLIVLPVVLYVLIGDDPEKKWRLLLQSATVASVFVA